MGRRSGRLVGCLRADRSAETTLHYPTRGFPTRAVGVVTLTHMSNESGIPPEVSALAINVAVPEELQWTDTRQDIEYRLQTLNIRLLPDGSLAAKAYGRPVTGGRGGYTSFRVPESPELANLISRAADEAGRLWSGHSSR